MTRIMAVWGLLRAMFRWPGGFLWMTLTPPIFLWLEMILKADQTFGFTNLFAPIVMTPLLRAFWLYEKGWMIIKCEYGQCRSEGKRGKEGLFALEVNGEYLFVCENCSDFVHDQIAMNKEIPPRVAP